MIKSLHDIRTGWKCFIGSIDVPLLVFLLLILNAKMWMKALALIFIYVLRPDFRFGIRASHSRIPPFYALAILIALTDLLLYGMGRNYAVVFATGIAFWACCLLAMHQVKYAVEHTSAEKVNGTIVTIFILNWLVSVVQLGLIMLEIGQWNPYTYQGNFQKYFIGTGDYIKGLSFDTSTTNAAINAFAVFYFLEKKKFAGCLAAMAVLLLTGSNFMTMVTIGVLLLIFIFRSSRDQKSVIVVCMLFLAVFMIRISPQNNAYAEKVIAGIFQARKNVQEKKGNEEVAVQDPREIIAKSALDSIARTMAQRATEDTVAVTRPVIPVPSIHSAPFQHKRDSSEARMQTVRFAQRMGRDTSLRAERAIATRPPGKWLAVRETLSFLRTHPARIASGDGMGRFSSKLAFRVTGLHVAGGFPSSYTYIDEDFRNNHLAVFLDYFEKDSGFHSITNAPNSAYLQMLGEYGAAGLLILAGYLWWFAKGWRRLSYGLPVLLVLAALLLVDYWFEQLSVVILFELMLFLDSKQKNIVTA